MAKILGIVVALMALCGCVEEQRESSELLAIDVPVSRAGEVSEELEELLRRNGYALVSISRSLSSGRASKEYARGTSHWVSIERHDSRNCLEVAVWVPAESRDRVPPQEIQHLLSRWAETLDLPFTEGAGCGSAP
jgi:hypothetical protein